MKKLSREAMLDPPLDPNTTIEGCSSMLDGYTFVGGTTVEIDSKGLARWREVRDQLLNAVRSSTDHDSIQRVLQARSFGLHDCDVRWLASREVWPLVPGDPVGCRGRPPASSVRVLSRREYGAFQHLMALIDENLHDRSLCPLEMFQKPAVAVSSVASSDISTRRLWHLFSHVCRSGVVVLYDSHWQVTIWMPQGVTCPKTLWNRHGDGFQRWSDDQTIARRVLLERLGVEGTHADGGETNRMNL